MYDKNISSHEYEKVLKELLLVRFNTPLFFKFISGNDQIEVSSIIDFMFYKSPIKKDDVKVSYCFNVYDIKREFKDKVDVSNSNSKPYYN